MTGINRDLQRVSLRRRTPQTMRVQGQGQDLGVLYKDPDAGATWGPYVTGCRIQNGLCYDVTMQRFAAESGVCVFMQPEPNYLVRPIQAVAALDSYYALLSDGTVVPVVALDRNRGQTNCVNWTGITGIAASSSYVLGIQEGGGVIFAGEPFQDPDYPHFGAWSGVQSVVTGSSVAIGITGDAPFVATYEMIFWENLWRDAANLRNVVGFDLNDEGGAYAGGVFLHADGTCTYYGMRPSDPYAQVASWSGVRQIACCRYDTIGLLHDGTCIAVGDNYLGVIDDVLSWTDIVSISANYDSIIGLKNDGSLVAGGHGDVPPAYMELENIEGIDCGPGNKIICTECSAIAHCADNEETMELAAMATTLFNYCF